jgi:hypothetical protein
MELNQHAIRGSDLRDVDPSLAMTDVGPDRIGDTTRSVDPHA